MTSLHVQEQIVSARTDWTQGEQLLIDDILRSLEVLGSGPQLQPAWLPQEATFGAEQQPSSFATDTDIIASAYYVPVTQPTTALLEPQPDAASHLGTWLPRNAASAEQFALNGEHELPSPELLGVNGSICQ